MPTISQAERRDMPREKKEPMHAGDPLIPVILEILTKVRKEKYSSKEGKELLRKQYEKDKANGVWSDEEIAKFEEITIDSE